MSKRALVVLSGGQDSTTCLYWAVAHFGGPQSVDSITFDYGQRHRIELEAAAHVAGRAGVSNTILPIDTFKSLGGNSLTAEEPVRAELNPVSALPNTFVPGRNLVFLTFAAAYAYQRGIHDLVTGVAQTDYSGYPDCRRTTMDSLEQTIGLGMEYEIRIHTPLMQKSKEETVRMALELGALEALAYTHTCYNGSFPPCATCPACLLRAKGFAAAGIEDPLVVRARSCANG